MADISVTFSATPAPGLAEAGTRLERDRVNAEPELARETGEVERQSLADGGSKLTPEYQSRIQVAEKLVEEAKQKLDQAD